MMKLCERIRLRQKIRVMGIDDSPFSHEQGQSVLVSGIICANTKFEGMIRTYIQKDGTDATEKLISMITQSKFYRQVQVVLLDGITLGGFNIVNLAALSKAINLPCIAVMRRAPNLEAIAKALSNLEDGEHRFSLIQQAGPVQKYRHFFFQHHNCSSEEAGAILEYLTDTGHVPEALRMAHLINSAIVLGQSNKRA